MNLNHHYSGTCYVVLGAYRSGTSLVSRILNSLGAFPGPDGELYEASDWNPGGYIQRPDITEFNTRLILKSGSSLDTPFHPLVISEHCRANDFSALNFSWAHQHPVFMVKDPRFCFTLFSWLKCGAFPAAKVKIVHIARDVEEAAKSARVHYDVKKLCGDSLDSAKKLIKRYDQYARWHAAHCGLRCLHVVYEDLLRSPKLVVKEISDFMGVFDRNKLDDAALVMNTGRSFVEK